MDSGLRFKVVCYIHGVVRDSYTHEVIDAHPQHTEKGHQEKVVKCGRYSNTHTLKLLRMKTLYDMFII